MGKETARAELGLFPSCRYFLFFNNNKSNIKRPDIARHIMERLGDGHSLLEVTNVPFQQLPIYYAASDFLLVTSDNEGSPNVVREALAMNLPVISRNVGDVASYISPFRSCLVIPENPEQAANLIREHLATGANTANELLRESLFERLDLDTNTRKCRNILASMK
jgi:glycosyltransferase involved in cell wall biosynthesis